MKDRFYIPFSLKIVDKPLIVYLVKDENPLTNVFDSKTKRSVVSHLKRLYSKNKAALSKGLYHIVFLWNLKNHRMADVWIHTLNSIAEKSGPLQEVHIFQDLQPYHIEVSSGDTLIVLAREEELRRKMADMKKYLNRPKYIPDFPFEMQPYEDFFDRI